MEEVEQKRRQNDTGVILNKIKKDYSYEWENLSFEYEHPFIFDDTVLYLENQVIFDMWKNNFDIEKNLHFNRHNQIHYEQEERKCIPFILRFENINGIVERSKREDDRNHYFKPTALLQTSLISNIFAQIEDRMTTILKIEYNSIVDSNKFIIDCLQKLPINRVLYFKNLIVCFEEVKEKTFQRRKQYQLIARIISGEVLLDKK